ncbi:hypothetical protein KUTeg_000123 [Tegillarca granosa]|uniref:Uncharacterized protein n=1 Tax=Tegillarca granosa TaxID=220873 RepID=A0ABQ9FWM3_TEGGR|nr:hypothetical protein KUTeg_000123 [Tegillarca granosa]
MATGALFGSTATHSSSKNLVEFRAGKMHMKGKMVHPDKRKGQVYVHQSDDSLMHFCWKERGTGTVEDEPKTDKDEEYCKKVNEYLNNPPAPGSNRGGLPGGLPPEITGDTDLQNILGGMSQQQPLRVQSSPGTRGSGTTTADTTSSSAQPRPVTAAALPSQTAPPSAASGQQQASGGSQSSRQQIQLSDLQNILSSMNVPVTPTRESVDLVQALNPESMIPILANPEVQERLIKFLPEGESLPKTEAELRNTVSSPQFQQYDKWSNEQRKKVLEEIVKHSKVKQLHYAQKIIAERVPTTSGDFTRELPRVVSLYIFSFLDPRSLCRCSRKLLITDPSSTQRPQWAQSKSNAPYVSFDDSLMNMVPRPVTSPPPKQSKPATARSDRDPPTARLFPEQPWRVPTSEDSDNEH